jgi:hypothetical protein
VVGWQGMPGGGSGVGSGHGYVPWRGEAEVFYRELEHMYEEPLVVCPWPGWRGRFPAPYLAGADLDVLESALRGGAGEGVGECLL